ncbi:MAG: hypothetical protein QM786_01620 [Breznakibacter sp.]
MNKHHILIGICALGIALPDALAQKARKTPRPEAVSLSWIDGTTPSRTQGTTWGTPWPQGIVRPGTAFQLNGENGQTCPLQTWPLAYWPDGSLKWSAHAVGPLSPNATSWKLQPVDDPRALKYSSEVSVAQTVQTIEVGTGALNCTFRRNGRILVSEVRRGTTIAAQNGQLVLLSQASPDGETSVNEINTFEGEITSVTVEQSGPVRAVVKVEGKHALDGHTQWLPFVLRFYFYAGAESFKIIHTIVYDGDEHRDFIKGIGIRFDVPICAELHDRHIRFVGASNGVFAEAVRTLTGLRRDAGATARKAQVDGEVADDIDEYVDDRLKYIPAFGDYTLTQLSPDAFAIKKRTEQGYAWIKAAGGIRAAGVGFVGSPGGGMAFGVRHFWQSYPSQIDIRNVSTDNAQVTLWLWSPEAQAMDLRFYHDGMGQNDYTAQWDGLEVTYEDYEPGYGTPLGIARTSEINFWFPGATPSRDALVAFAGLTENPPLLTAAPGYVSSTGAFGRIWGVRDTADIRFSAIEAQLDTLFNYYRLQQEQHKWYGFWDYGDVMHAYDPDRHVWRYDVGGYAWDNSELSTDLWLWYYYLHSGRADAFRMAEAMARHTGEVDVHHLGRFAPLGSRHNVQHWGCSAKQLRISTAANRRFLYYFTADERIGDLMDEQVNAYLALQRIDPMRKRRKTPLPADTTLVPLSFGTDWGAVAAAWLTHWERTRDEGTKQKLINSMASIAAQPNGFFSGSGLMDRQTGKFMPATDSAISVSHLNAVFGLFEICAELSELFEHREFNRAWIEYCTYYNASAAEQQERYGAPFGKLGLRQGHSRLSAYAAKQLKSGEIAQRALREFLGNDRGEFESFGNPIQVNVPNVLYPVSEVPGLSTNAAAQWGLSAIQCIELLKNSWPFP